MSGRMETRCDTCASYEYCDEIYECDDCRTEALQHAERQASVIARQARTIRRLRALADGYRDGLDDAIAKSKFVGARFERARIVAWLRGDCVHRDMGCDCHVIADAIERGEL